MRRRLTSGAASSEVAFELGDDCVDAGHGEVVGQGAVAVDLDAVVGAAVAAGDDDVVDVEDLGEVLGGFAEAALRALAVAFELRRGARWWRARSRCG